MLPVEALRVAPGAPAVLAPAADHLMLIGLERALAAGDEVVVVLEFEQAGEREIAIPVRDLRSATGEHHHEP
jgi:copper(I)-binding protein